MFKQFKIILVQISLCFYGFRKRFRVKNVLGIYVGGAEQVHVPTVILDLIVRFVIKFVIKNIAEKHKPCLKILVQLLAYLQTDIAYPHKMTLK